MHLNRSPFRKITVMIPAVVVLNYCNQMTGYDIRFSYTWFNVLFGVYYKQSCEDANGSAPQNIADCGHAAGVDTRSNSDSDQYKLFFEYTDTMFACGADYNAFNCMYEHSDYHSGSSYYGKTYGSTYESDTIVYAIGQLDSWTVGQLDSSPTAEESPQYLDMCSLIKMVQVQITAGYQRHLGKIY